MNLAEALLAADAGKIMKKQTKDLEIKRLSSRIGEPFVLHLRELSPRRVNDIAEMTTEVVDGKPKQNRYKMVLQVICEAVADKDFDNRDVLKHYGVATRKELFEKLFSVAEIEDIYTEANKLCGYGKEDETADEIKN